MEKRNSLAHGRLVVNLPNSSYKELIEGHLLDYDALLLSVEPSDSDEPPVNSDVFPTRFLELHFNPSGILLPRTCAQSLCLLNNQSIHGRGKSLLGLRTFHGQLSENGIHDLSGQKNFSIRDRYGSLLDDRTIE